MAEWVYANDFPNWSTLIVEIGIGVGLALTIFLLQSRTDKTISDVVEQIESYTEERKTIDDARRTYYINNIRRNLGEIQNQDRMALDITLDFLHFGNYPERDTLLELDLNTIPIPRMLTEISRWIDKLEDIIGNPQPLERFIEFITVLDAPSVSLSHNETYTYPRMLGVNGIVLSHLEEIDLFLNKLSEIEQLFQPVTNPTS